MVTFSKESLHSEVQLVEKVPSPEGYRVSLVCLCILYIMVKHHVTKYKL